MTGVEDKGSVYEVNGNKQIRFLSVRFRTFDPRIDFYRSVFLVQPPSVPARAPKRVKSTLRIAKLDDISKDWIASDILIFNSGHRWTPSKLFELLEFFWLSSWGMDRSPVSDTIIKVVRKMAVPVTIMHVTPMGAFRSDGHVGAWSDNPSVPDCSHWCLPGHLGYLICGMRFSCHICNHEIANIPPPFAAAINDYVVSLC